MIEASVLNRALTEQARQRLAREQPDGVDDQIILSAEEVRSLLDLVIDPILKRVSEQLSEWDRRPDPAADTAFLVGGFANSPYLQHRISRHLGHQLPLRLTPRPERAVLWGALRYCYNPALLPARRSKFTYGCSYEDGFEVGDRSEYVYVNEDGQSRTKNRFLRFVATNEKVPVDKEVPHILYPVTSSQTSVGFNFYTTAEPDARYIDDPGMKYAGSLKVSLDGAMHLPRAQRAVCVYMKFGEAQIRARAVNVTTGLEEMTTMTFESTR